MTLPSIRNHQYLLLACLLWWCSVPKFSEIWVAPPPQLWVFLEVVYFLSFFLSQLHLLLPCIASYPLKNFQTATVVHHHAMSFNPKSFQTRFVTELQEKGQAVGFGTYNRAWGTEKEWTDPESSSPLPASLRFQSQRWQVLSVSSAPWWLPFLWGKPYIPRGQKLQNTRDPKSSKLHTPTHTHPKLSELLWHIPHDKV